MCGPSDTHIIPARDESGPADDFPWHIGVCDAHCHPTDTMSSIASIPNMRTRVLTVMATRSQDQDLVASVGKQHGIKDRKALTVIPQTQQQDKIIPAFGWHPWFSYQLYDDTPGAGAESTYDPSGPKDEQKARHYSTVLSPAPDEKFIASLPDPLSLNTFIASTRQRVLSAGPTTTAAAVLIGEIGLDKAFRLPWPWNDADHSGQRDENLTPGGREGRTLSPHHVKMAHQIAVLKAQLRLAGELGVAVSVHGVQAHGVLFEALAALWKGHEKEVVSRRKQKMVAEGAEDFSESDEEEEEGSTVKQYQPKPFPPRVCLHSFSGSPQMVSQYLNPAIPVKVFFSFSTVINLSTAGGESKFPDVIKTVPYDRLLVESDLHTAGEDMDRVLEDISRKVCEIKEWPLNEGVERLRKNYEQFIFG